jgi:hypothetical protein
MDDSFKIIDSVVVSREKGGMLEFEKTGIYPDYLIFKSSFLKKSWRQRFKSEAQKGTIRSNGIILFHYQLTRSGIKLRYVDPDGTYTKWLIKDYIITMRD